MEERVCPSARVDVLAFAAEKGALKLLPVKRREAPFEGRWSIPGGSIGASESAEDAARRVLWENAGLRDVYLEQLYTFTGPGRAISIAHIALTPISRLREAARSRSDDACLFTVVREGGDYRLIDESGAGMAPEDMAFDHAAIVRTAIERMAGKLEYTEIGFRCLEDPSHFTLSQLCEVYAAIAGREYDLPNFRRFIKARYEATGRIVDTGDRIKRRGTQATVYRFVK